jgi:hypothetical protein
MKHAEGWLLSCHTVFILYTLHILRVIYTVQNVWCVSTSRNKLLPIPYYITNVTEMDVYIAIFQASSLWFGIYHSLLTFVINYNSDVSRFNVRECFMVWKNIMKRRENIKWSKRFIQCHTIKVGEKKLCCVRVYIVKHSSELRIIHDLVLPPIITIGCL